MLLLYRLDCVKHVPWIVDMLREESINEWILSRTVHTLGKGGSHLADYLYEDLIRSNTTEIVKKFLDFRPTSDSYAGAEALEIFLRIFTKASDDPRDRLAQVISPLPARSDLGSVSASFGCLVPGSDEHRIAVALVCQQSGIAYSTAAGNIPDCSLSIATILLGQNVVAGLISHGAEPFATTDPKRSPLVLATQMGREDVILVCITDVRALKWKDSHGRWHAASAGLVDSTTKLLKLCKDMREVTTSNSRTSSDSRRFIDGMDLLGHTAV